MSIKHCLYAVFILSFNFFGSCKKYLDQKSDQTLSTPQTLDDLQALNDNPVFNKGMNITSTSSDEYYLATLNDLNGLDELRRDGYVWESSMNDYADWQSGYQAVFYANTILDNLHLITKGNDNSQSEDIKGVALFYRAHTFYQLAQLYVPPYDASTAGNGLGLPLRLNADFNEPSIRATIQQTYDRIIQDLEEAVSLLPEIQLYKTRPGKAAVYALLARVYLQMDNYEKAKENADACLQLENTLLDFNQDITDPGSPSPISKFNEETIFYASTGAPANALAIAKIDSNLYKSFDEADWRKEVYFLANGDGSYRFKGSYSEALNDLFCGLAVDEVYLIRAEAQARLGATGPAMQDLNTLLVKRWKTGSFTPFTAATPVEAIAIILQERKKELIYRGLRWPDLRRLNKEVAYAITLERKLDAQTYLLPPNDLRYTVLIPLEVINLTNIAQNHR